MDLEDAMGYVKMQALCSDEPVLSDEEVLFIIKRCAIADKDGNAPFTPEWAETYWLTKAVSMAWDRKVDKAAQWVDVVTDGTHLLAHQSWMNLQRIADRWRRRCIAGG